jgi:hypothetical protein
MNLQWPAEEEVNENFKGLFDVNNLKATMRIINEDRCLVSSCDSS